MSKIHIHVYKQVECIYFPIVGFLAVRCCRLLLKKPEHPSGSQVFLWKCSVIYYGEHSVHVMKYI